MIKVTSMLAAPFPWVTNPSGHDFTVTVGGTPYSINVPSGTYRILLGKGGSGGGSTEPLADFLQVVSGVLNAAGTGIAWSVTLDPTTGLLTLAAASAFSLSGLYAPFYYLVGGWGVASGVTSIRANYPPQYCAFFGGRESAGDWVDETTVAGSSREDGLEYVLLSGALRWTDTQTWRWIPRDAATATSLGEVVTPWAPDPSFLATPGNTTGARRWSLADLRQVAFGKVLGLARGNFAALCASTSGGDLYDLVTLPSADLARPKKTNPYAGVGLERWVQWQHAITRIGSAPQSTRS